MSSPTFQNSWRGFTAPKEAWHSAQQSSAVLFPSSEIVPSHISSSRSLEHCPTPSCTMNAVGVWIGGDCGGGRKGGDGGNGSQQPAQPQPNAQSSLQRSMPKRAPHVVAPHPMSQLGMSGGGVGGGRDGGEGGKAGTAEGKTSTAGWLGGGCDGGIRVARSIGTN